MTSTAPSPSTLASFTSPELIIPQLRNRDATSVVAELCSTMERQGRVKDLLPFYNAVLSHELVSSTAIAPGWAMPHARIPGSGQLSFGLGRSAEPLAWFGSESQTVSLVFLFMVPDSESGTYLNLISQLARLSEDRARVERLLRAPDSQSLFELLGQLPLRRSRAQPARA